MLKHIKVACTQCVLHMLYACIVIVFHDSDTLEEQHGTVVKVFDSGVKGDWFNSQ